MSRVLVVVVLSAALTACGYSPTGPTSGRMTLAISESIIPIGSTAVVTATLRGSDGAPVHGLVAFSSTMGTFTPPEAYTVNGVATSTFTGTRAGMGAIGALSGSVAAESLQVRVGDVPAIPVINTPPPVPSVFLSCNDVVTAGTPAVCSVSGLHLQTLSITWGDGSAEQYLNPAITSVGHVYERAGRYTVIVRGGGEAGQVVHASATATINNPPPPPPVVTPPVATTTSVFMSQEADAGTSGCAAFRVSATPQNGRSITSIVVTHSAGQGPWTFTGSSGRFATCGLNDDSDILTATATDSSGDQARYQLIVR